MNRAARFTAILLLCLIGRPVTAGRFSPVANAAPHPAVCRVAVEERDGQAFGSGTLIDAREQYGLVVTNWHVVRDAVGKIEVRFPDGHVSEARPLKLDETWDLAALVVWRPPTEPVRLAARPPQQGDQLTICGYGQGDYRALTGRCTDYYAPEVGEPQELVELNVEARQGDSGGPIFNSRGELAGVLFGAARGTTLGSFGGRVQTFLATLAPDIGARPSTLVAQSQPALPALGRAGVQPGPVDPFLAAERRTPTPRPQPTTIARAPRQVDPQTGEPRTADWQTVDAQTPPPALTDRNSAPRLAAARQSADAWQPAPAATPPDASHQWFAKPAAANEVGARWAPHSSDNVAAAGAAMPRDGNIDWTQDARTMLAVFGVAALVVSVLRAAA